MSIIIFFKTKNVYIVYRRTIDENRKVGTCVWEGDVKKEVGLKKKSLISQGWDNYAGKHTLTKPLIRNRKLEAEKEKEEWVNQH